MTDRFAYELPPQTRTQLVLDRLMDDPPDMPNSVPGYDRLLPRVEVYDSIKSPEADPVSAGGKKENCETGAGDSSTGIY